MLLVKSTSYSIQVDPSRPNSANDIRKELIRKCICGLLLSANTRTPPGEGSETEILNGILHFEDASDGLASTIHSRQNLIEISDAFETKKFCAYFSVARHLPAAFISSRLPFSSTLWKRLKENNAENEVRIRRKRIKIRRKGLTLP